MSVVFFLFSIHKRVRPADADKMANSAQPPKSLGTTALTDSLEPYGDKGHAGPALASAGPDLKHYCGAPLSGV